ncbi:MAG: pirin family protein [Gordonia sp.]|nr:pirin family protein [Gordonia sp. (in: high G+C Gram-positive bacteria)]
MPTPSPHLPPERSTPERSTKEESTPDGSVPEARAVGGPAAGGLRIIRNNTRDTTTTDWATSRHSFSFGDHYDPDNTHFGTLLVNNEEFVSPGRGFDTHPHRETEIITWVTEGSLVHQDSEGHSGIIHPGLAQRMSAGTGIAHSERNDSTAGLREPVRFTAMWIAPDESGAAPSYAQQDVSGELARGGLVAVASGDPAHDSAIRIANRSATLFAARLPAGVSATLPAARLTHLFLTTGSVRLAGAVLGAGDAVRAGDVGGESITAISDAEVLVWAMNRRLGE